MSEELADIDAITIALHVDGMDERLTVSADLTLLDVLREELGLTEVRVGCRNGDCGACTAIVDGRCVKTCLILAGRADGTRVETIAHLADGDEPSPIQQAFMEQYGFQCGFCLPGMLLSATDLLDRTPEPSVAQIRDTLSGNLCRCTGYVNVVRAVGRAAELRRQQAR